MRKCKGHLKLEERQAIYILHSQGVSFGEIGRRIGRNRSTIYRELQRNKAPVFIEPNLSGLEKAKLAQDKAKRRRSDSKKVRRSSLKLALVRNEIINLLKVCRYSPEAISATLAQGDLGVNVSGRTIRRWLQKDAKELRKYLPERGRKRRNKLTPSKRKHKKAASKKCSIHTREEAITKRARVGDYEADAIVCSQSTTAIISLRERLTRKGWFIRVPNLKADTVRPALIKLFRDIPMPLLLSCAFDNGGEFSDFLALEKLFGIKTFFCDPYSAWQKGGVENLNKAFRVFVPKGTNLATINDIEIAKIENIINARPMDCLHKLSPDQAWVIALKKTEIYLH